eukprot:CAMPEP_0201662410 /NCGR_PEP_ID=MMETSP0494-20130426/4503_1 /ASSEMBLY_ACC=CAM_ASM_000839 /TAXON_ID=420259 /ORGANISM="Thalassiosira gravida, Strain GMp14c1" /LENGTH=266 /DNA_ID=CAMNT_0048140765 /DNA_START=357 /DNA_END=1157 /DNA_ORIENTATION=-
MTKAFLAGGVSKEMWSPYFEEIAKRTVEAAKDHDKVVLTHASYKEPFRELVIAKILEGGVSLDQITIVELTIDPVVKTRGLYYRGKRQAEQNGMSFTDVFKAYHDFEGELTEEKFIEYVLKTEEGAVDGFDDCPNAKKVDVSGRDISHCDNLDKALALTRSKDWTYETICEKVLPLDVKRDEEAVASGSMDEFHKILAELNPSLAIDESEGEEKVKEMKKRRSTLVQIDLMRDFSQASIEVTEEAAERRASRRVSLIKTGKIDFEE